MATENQQPNITESEDEAPKRRRLSAEEGAADDLDKPLIKRAKRTAVDARRDCPYLGTINRHLLDFDFEKVCSVSLSATNIYVDLVDGKYFQGRGPGTHAHRHALENEHYVWMHLETGKVYCIPDDYEVVDASLDDIKYNLHPLYTEDQVLDLSTSLRLGKSLDGADYVPGCVGLNSIGTSDYLNVVVQTLIQCIPLRNFLMMYESPLKPDRVVTTLAELARKIFNPRNFKGFVSPHEFLQACSVATKKKFFTTQKDPAAFMAWLLTRLHTFLKDKKTGKSILNRCFEGEVVVRTSLLNDDSAPTLEKKEATMFLTLEPPPEPLFKDQRDFIPRCQLFVMLEKFNGETMHTTVKGEVKRYSLRRLPPYLIMVFKRFKKNNFAWEKNPTIVEFPVKNLDLKDYLAQEVADERFNPETRYDLVSSICHTGKPEAGNYKCFVHHSPSQQWQEIQDLRVTPVLPQVVALAESYIQMYQRADVQADGSFTEVDWEAALEHVEEQPVVDDVAPEDLAEAGIIIG